MVIAFKWLAYFITIDNYFHNHCSFANTLQNHNNHGNHTASTVMEMFHYFCRLKIKLGSF